MVALFYFTPFILWASLSRPALLLPGACGMVKFSHVLKLRRADAVLQANFSQPKKMLYSFFVGVELPLVGQVQTLRLTGLTLYPSGG